MLGTKIKDPSDVLDYDITYEDWITDDDTITTVVTSVSPAGELAVDSAQVATPDVKIWVSGGVAGSTYEITVTASTTAGRVKEETFKLRVKEA